jgi:hypothetical protein
VWPLVVAKSGVLETLFNCPRTPTATWPGPFATSMRGILPPCLRLLMTAGPLPDALPVPLAPLIDDECRMLWWRCQGRRLRKEDDFRCRLLQQAGCGERLVQPSQEVGSEGAAVRAASGHCGSRGRRRGYLAVIGNWPPLVEAIPIACSVSFYLPSVGWSQIGGRFFFFSSRKVWLRKNQQSFSPQNIYLERQNVKINRDNAIILRKFWSYFTLCVGKGILKMCCLPTCCYIEIQYMEYP